MWWFREDEGPKKSRGVKPEEIKKSQKEESEEKAAKEKDESETDDFLRLTYILLTMVSFFSALDNIIQSKDSYVFSYLKYNCLQSCKR